jgi:hypothetical protein
MMSNLQSDQAADELQQELQAVEQELLQALTDLYAPLADLARNQFHRSQPLTRAALVLAVGSHNPADGTLRHQRLSLAAAQEMLFIALSIHKMLLTQQPRQQDEQQKTIMGGIILTGDYCFTRSAILAAQTDHVKVVELFSQALKSISEGLLRNFFAGRSPDAEARNGDASAHYNERTDLFVSGVEAAAVLVDLPEEATADLVAFARNLAQHSPPYNLPDLTAQAQAIRRLAPSQRARLNAFLSWLAAQEQG